MTRTSYSRPSGVTVLGWLCLGFAILMLVAIAAAYRHPEVLPQWHTAPRHGTTASQANEFGDVVLVAIPTAIASIVIGFGLLALRSWARWALLVIFGLGFCRLLILILAVLAVTKAKMTVSPSLAIAIAIDAAMVYYLTRPHVKGAFGEGTDYRM